MPAIAAVIIQALLWLVRSRIGFIITTILLWLGVSLTTNKVVLQPIMDSIQGYVSGLGSSTSSNLGQFLVAYVRFLNFDKALTMVFSAYVAKQAVSASKVFLAKRAG